MISTLDLRLLTNYNNSAGRRALQTDRYSFTVIHVKYRAIKYWNACAFSTNHIFAIIINIFESSVYIQLAFFTSPPDPEGFILKVHRSAELSPGDITGTTTEP